MHQRRPLCILIGPHGRDHGSNTGSDVLSHDDGNRRAERNLSRHGQSLQNSHRRGTGLKNGREDHTCDHSQNRIPEHHEKLPEPSHILESGNRVRHCLHAEHQRSKSQKDHTRILLPVTLTEHIENDACQCQNRSQGGRL